MTDEGFILCAFGMSRWHECSSRWWFFFSPVHNVHRVHMGGYTWRWWSGE